MVPTLEGFVIALFLAVTPADHASRAHPIRTAAPAAAVLAPKDAALACRHYESNVARRNCIARLGRPIEQTNAAPYPSDVTWIAPAERDMAVVPLTFGTRR